MRRESAVFSAKIKEHDKANHKEEVKEKGEKGEQSEEECQPCPGYMSH